MEKIKVIYYEDNTNLREGISFLIQSNPQLDLLATFSNADTVKTDTEELKPDVILMDIQMPEMDGLEATKVIRSKNIKQPVIIAMTANSMPEDRDLCLASGMNDYLSKPIKFEDLVKALEKASATMV